MGEAETQHARSARTSAPWGGRPRVENPKDRRLNLRCTAAQYAEADQAATRAGIEPGRVPPRQGVRHPRPARGATAAGRSGGAGPPAWANRQAGVQCEPAYGLLPSLPD